MSSNGPLLEEISFGRLVVRSVLERLVEESPKLIAESESEILDKLELLSSELQLLGFLLDRQAATILAQVAAKRRKPCI